MFAGNDVIAILNDLPKNNVKIVIGDWNAKVGTDRV